MEGDGDDEGDDDVRPIVEAKSIYILMSKHHRISRNRRAEWLFSRFDTVLSLPQEETATEPTDEASDFFVVSAIPREPYGDWSPEARFEYRYRITTRTIVIYLSRQYRIVYCVDVSPSVAAVDIQSGTVLFDGVFQALKASLDGLMRPFIIPGTTTVFNPKIFITVISHSPFVATINNEVIVQGKLLCSSTYDEILETVFAKLNETEDRMAAMTETLLKNISLNRKKKCKTASGENTTVTPPLKSSVAMSSDFALVDLLKQALIAVSLLPENSSSGLVILTDGVLCVPDGRYLDIILSQMRYNTVSCSFIQLGSSFHPHICHGVVPYVDLMKFIASATFGAFLTEAPEVTSTTVTEMNAYHLAFLAWSFQSPEDAVAETVPPVPARPGDWFIRNKCFFSIRDMPILKKQQFQNSLDVDYMKVLSCRLREGFMIKEVRLNEDNQYEIVLTLPWKFLIHLEYTIVTDKSLDSPTECILCLEGPYDFLHDVTCLASKSFPSFYRQLMVNRFWATRKNLSESDRLLVHLNSFSSDPAYYSIPDSLRNGVPLFYFSSNATVPQLQSSDFPYMQFAQFWKPVCMLDTNVWQKWMHTHRIGVILEHDHPLPKHLNCPNAAGRYQIILCRQAITSLNALIKNFSSFVLVENHSYVSLMYKDDDEKDPPFSFYIIRVTSKPPYIVLRLAFLVGTPGNLRHKTVTMLREKITALTFPQRLKEPPRWRFPSGSPHNADQTVKTWSDMHCCIIMNKPIEKILIRYEKLPDNFCEVLMCQQPSDNSTPTAVVSKSSQQSTFGFKPTHPMPGTTSVPMVPEMFNTVARYLHHHRWIWFFPKCNMPEFTGPDASEILTIIIKMRLQEGFRFAYSSSGTVNMVLEVRMKNNATFPSDEFQSLEEQQSTDNEDETYWIPCVIQFVMFPPCHSLISPCDDDVDIEEDVKDLYLVMECWIEPQCGKIDDCQFPLLNGLEYFEVPQKLLNVNEECLLTLGAFDYLKGAPKRSPIRSRRQSGFRHILQRSFSVRESNIELLPFEFELGRVLPKCSQTELLYSMFFQDLRQVFSVKGKNEFVPYNERANEILYNSWISHLSSVHDKEIFIETRYFDSLISMVLSRDDITKWKDTKINVDELPGWKCFVKSVDPTNQLITLLPKSFRDAKLLFLIIEKLKCVVPEDKKRQADFTFPTSLGSVESQPENQSQQQRQRKISEPNCNQKRNLDSSLAQQSASSCTVSGRKRMRALSGGESGPVLKKALTIEVEEKASETLAQNFFEQPKSKYIVKQEQPGIATVEMTGSEVEPNNPEDTSGTFFSLPPLATEPSVVGSLSMPLFMYDCSLLAIRNHLIYKGATQPIVDKCLDFRIFAVTQNAKTDLTGNPSAPTNEGLPLPQLHLEQYYNSLKTAFNSCFVRSVFHCLQQNYSLSNGDLSAVLNLCQTHKIRIDITQFIKQICGHVHTAFSCDTQEEVQTFIRRKFGEIITKRFNCAVVNEENLFYYKIHRSTQDQDVQFWEYQQSTPISEFDADRPTNSGNLRISELWSNSTDQFTFSDFNCSTRRFSESGDSDRILPLFMILRVSFTSEKLSSTIVVSSLPVCTDEISKSMGKEDFEGESGSVHLEALFLTCPFDHLQEETEIKSVEECQNISEGQSQSLSSMMEEIQWLLNDEITSHQIYTLPLSPQMLADIALHVESYSGKEGCFQQSLPLKFVVNTSMGFQNFVESFRKLQLANYRFENLGNWWYLISTSSEVAPSHSDSTAGSRLLLVQSDDNESNAEYRLPFWIIFRIEEANVYCYCHCRNDECNSTLLRQCVQTKDLILNGINQLIRTVNQNLLLQSLHDTRICSPLLEAEKAKPSIDQILPYTKNEEVPLSIAEGDTETQNACPPGTFACDVVYEKIFELHPRLSSGPGKSAFSRGVQILRSTLMAFEVNNRENMFVYRNSSGNVYYLRLYRVIEKLEDVYGDIGSDKLSRKSSISSKTRLGFPSEFIREDSSSFLVLEDISCLSSTMSDGAILLRVHGITGADTEIKEQLIQSLCNKLDDAVLEVLSVTLDRNPHCKLTPEDVHFIQKSFSTADAVIRFSTGRFVKLLLSPFAFYLHQNLLQFFNTPKYTRNEKECHFQDYNRAVNNVAPDEQNVYLYNQSPGGTGSRGIACVSVTLTDRGGRILKCSDWKRPWNFQFSLSLTELASFIDTAEIVSGSDLSDIVVEMCVWKQGRINLDILRNNFLSAIKHAGWDLAMEYQVLTPPLLSPKALEDQATVEHDKDLLMGYKLSRSPTSGSPVYSAAGRILRRRNSSAAPLATFEDIANDDHDPRGRSWSCSVKKHFIPIQGARLDTHLEPSLSKSSLRGSTTASTETIRSGIDFIGLRKDITDHLDKLHINYARKFKKWCHIGTNLNLPSLRMETVDFKPQQYLNETVDELIKIVHMTAPDNSTAQFWNVEKNMREILIIGDRISMEYETVQHKVHRDVHSFKTHDAKLKNLENKDEAEYPVELLSLFTSRENFDPACPKTGCILICRNLIHWEACIADRKMPDPSLFSSEVVKSFYRFFPLLSEPANLFDDKSSLNAEKLKYPLKNGLLAMLGDVCDESCLQSVLVPRQRFLLLDLSKHSIDFFFYNWSKESSDKLIDQTKILARWNELRWQLMNSVLLQKSGLFYHQPYSREAESKSNVLSMHADLRELVKIAFPSKAMLMSKNQVDNRNELSDLYRNLRHGHILQLRDDGILSPISMHGEQAVQLLPKGKKEFEVSVFRSWLSRGPSASNIIGKEAIAALKAEARIIHYCMTPIFFLPRWRSAIALTRDSITGIFKRTQVFSEVELAQISSSEKLRPRHASGTSFKSVQSGTQGNIPLWSLWRRLQFERNSEEDVKPVGNERSPKRSESWYSSICNTYIQEYLQYLQTLGYIEAQGDGHIKKHGNSKGEGWSRNNPERGRRTGDNVQSSDSEKVSRHRQSPSEFVTSKPTKEKNGKAYYVQKILQGGIILLEVGFLEPFSYCTIHALEVHRLQGNKFTQRSTTSHNTIAFVDECDKMKILMHLHSFAYDFHLRIIQHHICGKQLIKQGYHVTKFLDDFISYYSKGPSFARNTVTVDVLSIQNITTPCHILFDYLLTHNKKYRLSMLKMDQLPQHNAGVDKVPLTTLDHTDAVDCVLVHTLSKKVAYKASEDEGHLGEFEISLVIAHDTPSSGKLYCTDPSVLRLKYHIVLTSRREVYPNLTGDLNHGKLFPVTVSGTLSNQMAGRRDSETKRKSVEDDTSFRFLDTEMDSRSLGNQSDKESSVTEDKPKKKAIREEKVHYMGYFSSHEQVMQKIVKEQTVWAEEFILAFVEAAAIDCRRDLLWQRLQVGGKQILLRPEKDELTLRETVGVLTFWEFGELLELIQIQTLRKVDPHLQLLLSQPLNFFQTLIKLLSNVGTYEHRYFVGPDGNIHQLVLINPHVKGRVVLVEFNVTQKTSDLSILHKQPRGSSGEEQFSEELDEEMQSLIETVISACCFCCWINCL